MFYVKKFFKLIFYFLCQVFYLLYDLIVKYYYMILLDFYRFKDSLILLKDFFKERFSLKSFFTVLVGFLTFFGLFTVYPLYLFLVFIENVQDIFIRYGLFLSIFCLNNIY